ncbi:hypothetical protein Emag_006852 [Eimeria magna]
MVMSLRPLLREPIAHPAAAAAVGAAVAAAAVGAAAISPELKKSLKQQQQQQQQAPCCCCCCCRVLNAAADAYLKGGDLTTADGFISSATSLCNDHRHPDLQHALTVNTSLPAAAAAVAAAAAATSGPDLSVQLCVGTLLLLLLLQLLQAKMLQLRGNWLEAAIRYVKASFAYPLCAALTLAAAVTAAAAAAAEGPEAWGDVLQEAAEEAERGLGVRALKTF